MHCRHENSWRPGQARPWLPQCQCHCLPCWWLEQNCSPSKPLPGPECSNKNQGVKRNQGWHCHLKEFNIFKLRPPVKNTWQRHGMACKGLQRHDAPWKQLEWGTRQALAPSVPMSLCFMLMILTVVFTIKAFARAWLRRSNKDQNVKEIKAVIWETRRRMARERRGAGSSLVSMETPY